MHPTIETISHLYPFTPKKLEINGHHLSYLDEGQGPVVVMLHGNPTWSFYYRNLVQLLRKDYRVIAPDHMGCGLSDKPQHYEYTLKTHIDNLDKLLNHLKVDTMTLVMHDWGGAIAMGYTARHPQKVNGFVVMNTAAFRSKRIPWRIAICRIPLLGDVLVRGLNGFAGAATFMAVNNPLPADVKRGYLLPYNSWRSRIAVLRFVQDIPMSEGHRSWQTLLAVEQSLAQHKDKPMLLMWGGRDFCFTKHFFDEWQRRFPKAASRYYEDAGHYVLEDAFDQASKEIVAFLEGVHQKC